MHFKASNVPFREQGFHESLKGELGKKKIFLKVGLFYHPESHHNHSRKLRQPGILPEDKPEGKLFCF